MGWDAKVLTVSDSVHAGTALDRSGRMLCSVLEGVGFHVAEHRCIPDGRANVANALRDMTEGFTGVVVTTGGTGFAPRDLTPEGTLDILERHAPALAQAMHQSSPKARLSRGIAGTVGRSLVLNLPGSPSGSSECLGAVIDVVPHALSLLSGDNPHPHATRPVASS